ncbi:MAG: FAD-dependent oxidoreductase [Candidatus Sumerlaeia bacterium]
MTSESTKAWRCSVCGYVHRGDEPPEECPVCGAPKEDFEAYEEQPVKPEEKGETKQWRCMVCNYIHDGSEPPEECPRCGASKDQFEPLEESEEEGEEGEAAKTVVIVGGGIAGLAAAEAVRTMSDDAKIILIQREDKPPYYRLNLTRYLAGDVKEKNLPIHPEDWYAEKNIDLRLNTAIREIDAEGYQVKTADGDSIEYERLILTTGAHPFVPPIPGAQKKGVYTIRTKDDCDAILGLPPKDKQCVVIGGGILGLETAGALADQGAEVTLLESYGWLLPRQLNEKAGKLLADHAASRDINIISPSKVEEIVGDEAAHGVKIKDQDELIDAEIVIITTGVRTNSFLARQAGLKVEKGVVVNDLLQTSNSDIYAAGDVCEHQGVLYGIWAPAQYQGDIAGRNAAGANIEFGGVPRSNTLKVLGKDMFSVGEVQASDGSYTEIEEEKDGVYHRFLFQDGQMRGAIFLGDSHLSNKAKEAVETQEDFSGLLDKDPDVGDILDYLEDFS